jgi:hypothetical protein
MQAVPINDKLSLDVGESQEKTLAFNMNNKKIIDENSVSLQA